MSARSDMDKLPGLKDGELARLGPCAVCRKPMLPGDFTFYIVRLKRAGWDREALTQQLGLGLQLGSASLAAIMGPDRDLAKVFDGPVEVVVHETCASEIHHLLNLWPEAKVDPAEPESVDQAAAITAK